MMFNANLYSISRFSCCVSFINPFRVCFPSRLLKWVGESDYTSIIHLLGSCKIRRFQNYQYFCTWAYLYSPCIADTKCLSFPKINLQRLIRIINSILRRTWNFVIKPAMQQINLRLLSTAFKLNRIYQID